ncbi:ABC transporter ATP-binding protein [Paraliobacillus sediminis]|uniref:ABC transporter ATP-binding protein n=1 Tax=Paraliobacillus sediminis TaxID=1885916 RepID=UPI000E3C96D6|nr:ABC transporter ATP-binding protein [Paraliobacillus sediminis]
MGVVLSLENVTKIINRKTIIDDISLTVEEGEVFGFLGPNGAGKTTTIRMIVGLMKITSGDIAICGNSVKTNFEDAAKQIGAIVENPEMYKHLSGYQNLLQYARMHKQVTKEKIKEVIDLVGLSTRINDKVKTYSLGMRQRLGMAQCLLHDPKLLILDEPTNGLDPAGIREIREHLSYLTKERNMSVIVSSHLLAEMEMMCDRIAIIQQGKIIDVHNMNASTTDEKTTHFIETSELDTASNWLNENWQVSYQTGGFTVQATKVEIAVILKKLIDSEISVYGTKQLTKTLEDRFLEVTSTSERSQY